MNNGIKMQTQLGAENETYSHVTHGYHLKYISCSERQTSLTVACAALQGEDSVSELLVEVAVHARDIAVVVALEV